MVTRALVALLVLLATFGASSPAAALTPRVAICGRVTLFADAPTPGDDIVRLGTQEPRRLSLASGIPQIGQEICIWGVDVVNVNPPLPDLAPSGIVDYRIALVSSIGCADVVTATSASFLMPGQEFEAPQNIARLRLPLTALPGNGCVRIAVDAQGNPVAVVLARAAATSPAMTPVVSLPNTSTSDDRRMPSRDTIVTVVLGGELAVPCTRNPLQRG